MADPIVTAPVVIDGAPEPAPVTGWEVEPGRVAVTKDGEDIQSLPIEQYQEAALQGFRPASKAEYRSAHEGAYGAFKAGVYGAARGASFGAFDPIAVAASKALYGEQGAELARDELLTSREGHEGVTLVGELAGSLAPLSVGAPPAEALAAGESMLARLGSRALAAAPRAFGEGALIGAGQQLTEDTLGNHELVAQKYVGAALKGGVFGALIGAGLHAGGGAIGDALASRATRVAELAGETGAARAGKPLLARAEEFAEMQAAKAALPASTLSGSEMQKLGRTVEERASRMREVGRTLLDEGITTPGAGKAKQAERLVKRIEEVGDELGTIRKGLDRANVRPSAMNIMKEVDEQILFPLANKPFAGPTEEAIRPILRELAMMVDGKPTFESFEELHKIRRALDDRLYPKRVPGFSPPPVPQGVEQLQALRGILETEYERAADAAARELGEDLATKYRVSKALFSDLKTAEGWAQKAAAREEQHRAISLTDTIMMASHGAAAGIGNKLARTYGNQTTAFLVDRASKLKFVQDAAAAWDKRLGTAVTGFYKGTQTAKARGTGRSPKIDPKTARMLRAAVTNPATMTARVEEVVASTGLKDEAPRVAQGIASTIMRAATYLHQNIPPEPPPAGFQFGPSEPRALGPQAQARMEAVVGALDLEGLLSDIERGRVDRQKVEALRIIYPEAHAEILGALERHGREHAAQLTHQQEVALSILLGKPIGAMMQPRTIRGFQQAHVQGTPPDPAEAGVQRQPFGNAGGGSSGRHAQTHRSGTDRMEAADAM